MSTTAGGYFAFPPIFVDGDTGTSHMDEREQGQTHRRRSCDAPRENASVDDELVKDDEMTKEEEEEEKRREAEGRKRREKARELASLGEFEWVRSGGVLRDAEGRRDKVRTENIKQEIRLQEKEKLLTERWEAYEARWRALLLSDERVSFKEIPWPLQSTPQTAKELTFAAISEFLLEPLTVRSNTVTRRERIRTSLLRWHPDKMSSVLSRVTEDDRISVREGLGVVMMSLKRMKDN